MHQMNRTKYETVKYFFLIGIRDVEFKACCFGTTDDYNGEDLSYQLSYYGYSTTSSKDLIKV